MCTFTKQFSFEFLKFKVGFKSLLFCDGKRFAVYILHAFIAYFLHAVSEGQLVVHIWNYELYGLLSFSVTVCINVFYVWIRNGRFSREAKWTGCGSRNVQPKTCDVCRSGDG